MSAAPDSASFFRRLAAETDESAAVGLFVELCRSSAPLRHWLWEDFARDAATRAKFASALENSAGEFTRFADLGGESDAWRTERARLRAKLRREYGGLSFDEVVRLLLRHIIGAQRR